MTFTKMTYFPPRLPVLFSFLPVALCLVACNHHTEYKKNAAKPTITFSPKTETITVTGELLAEQQQADQEALLALANQYRLGKHIEKDTHAALAIYEKLALAGNREALDIIAEAYPMYGWHIHHPQRAVYWWEKLAQLGNIDAMIKLGSAHARAYGTSLNKHRAQFWFNKAITKHARQRRGVAMILSRIDNDVSRDLQVYYLKKAITAQDRQTSHLLYKDILRQKQKPEILKIISVILEQDTKAEPEYYYLLAENYKKNNEDERYITFLQQASRMEYIPAIYQLAGHYLKGDYVQQDLKTALKWHLKAASHGHTDSQYAVGMAYAHGNGVSRNRDKAVYWLVKSGHMPTLEAQQMVDSLPFAKSEKIE